MSSIEKNQWAKPEPFQIIIKPDGGMKMFVDTHQSASFVDHSPVQSGIDWGLWAHKPPLIGFDSKPTDHNLEEFAAIKLAVTKHLHSDPSEEEQLYTSSISMGEDYNSLATNKSTHPKKEPDTMTTPEDTPTNPYHIDQIAAALCRAQSEITGAIADKTNPAFKSKYADLSSVLQAIKGPFAGNHLSFIQVFHEFPGGVGVETVLMHASGQKLSGGVVRIPATKQDAQGYGSAITYARRYSLSTMVGITAEDDDGNAAASSKAAYDAKPQTPPADTKQADMSAAKAAWDAAHAAMGSLNPNVHNKEVFIAQAVGLGYTKDGDKADLEAIKAVIGVKYTPENHEALLAKLKEAKKLNG